nr:unnamed protein product [Callosobruchus chinensis]
MGSIKKIRSLLPKFRRVANILHNKSLKTLYFALIQSHLNYGVLEWGEAAPSHLRSLEIVQKRFKNYVNKEQNVFL